MSRIDIRPKQTQILLDSGFIPVSVDYRFCPETNLLEGPMTDVRDALAWVRNTLPSLARKRSDVRITGDRVVAVGWSTGGHLALSLGWTAAAAGVQPPQAILAFYSPSDYEDECWSRRNGLFGQMAMTTDAYDLWEGLADSPIAVYRPPSGGLNNNDARSRIVLHMTWYGQTVPVLIHGLKDKDEARNRTEDGALVLPTPTLAQIQAISPLAQIRQGTYRTPTFLIHPHDDRLIPWQQARRTIDELRSRGIESELRIVYNVDHLFDLHLRDNRNEGAVRAVTDGYSFLSSHG